MNPLPYSPTTTPRRMALTAYLLAGLAAAPVAGVVSDVAFYTVADSTMLTLVHDQTMRMFLQARVEVGRAAGAAGSMVPVDVAVTGDGRRLQRTTRQGRDFPTANHPDVIAYTRVANADWQPARVLGVNWNTGVVSVETPNNAGKIRVYYTFGDGEISVRVSRPYGSSTGATQIFASAARSLHETDQTDRDTARALVSTPLPVPEKFRLTVAVRAASAVYFDGLAKHDVILPATETAIMVYDPSTLADMAERQLRGG